MEKPLMPVGVPITGSEARVRGTLTRSKLRSGYVLLHRDVYAPRGTRQSASSRGLAAWLWSRRMGVLAGRSAAALHGAKWVDDDAPAQLLHRNRRPPEGIETWSDRFESDEVQLFRGVPVTTPARTALDLACRLPLDDAVAAIDALANATKLAMADVDLLVQRYGGRRALRQARTALDLVDAGAESPQETRLRLMYVRAGFPRPETQIRVHDEYGQLVAVLDMGWRDVMVGTDYDGEHHRLTRRQLSHDIKRYDTVTELGWLDQRVTVEDTDATVIERTRRDFERRGVVIQPFAAQRAPMSTNRAKPRHHRTFGERSAEEVSARSASARRKPA